MKPNRLFDSFDTTAVPTPTDPTFSSLQGRGFRGSPTLLLSPSSYTSSLPINLTLEGFEGNAQQFKVVPIVLSGSSKVLITPQPNGWVVTPQTGGYCAVVACQTSNSSISLQQYEALETASNVVVIEFLTQPTSSLDSLVSNHVKSYAALASIPLSAATGLAGIFSSLGKTLADARDPARESNSSQSKVDGAREDNIARINGLTTAVRDVHLDSEVGFLTQWLRDWDNIDSPLIIPEPLRQYGESLGDSLESIVQTEKTRAKDLGSGQSVTKSTSAQHIEGADVRINSGSVIDLYSPSLHSNTEHTVLQSKNFHNHAYLAQWSSVRSWDRAESLRVQIQGENFQYTEKSSTVLAANQTQEVGDAAYYYDHLTLQVGQESRSNVSDAVKLKGSYGTAEISIRQDLSVQTVEGEIAIRSANTLALQSSDNLYAVSESNCLVAADQNLYLSGGSGTILAAPTVMVSGDNVTVESRGVQGINGFPVLINSGFSVPVVLDLDSQEVLGYSGISTPLETSTPEDNPLVSPLNPRAWPTLKELKPYSRQDAPKAIGHQSNGVVAESPTP